MAAPAQEQCVRSLAQAATVGASVLLIVVTVLPFIPTNAAWVRVWDFPRQQIAALLVAALFGAFWQLDVRTPLTQVLVILSFAALGVQAWQIWPYTPVHAVQADFARTCARDDRISLLVANVLFTNRNSEALFRHIRQMQPDLVLLVEINAWWEKELAPLRADYPHVVGVAREVYGMYLFSRLELNDPQIRYVIERDVPSIRAGVKLRSGATFMLYGLHPKPPPHQDTAQRDAELVVVGREAKEAGAAIVAGDLNDVAWSRTTHLFQEISGLLDPRIGRGFYSTYNANWPLLRWPLDHAFFDQSFLLHELRVLSNIGSDHFPLYIALCHDPRAGASQDAPQPERADEKEADEAVKAGRGRARER
jgi:endonuclease/exonuclease/phosphatase (EEP) superfamily protein YafD